MMWYGVLGTKELLHRTYKNLEQRVLLEVRPGPEQDYRILESDWFHKQASGSFILSLFSLCSV